MVAAIIQARLGSTRLPGKVLKMVEGKTLLEHLLLRLNRAKTLDKINVATTEKIEDQAIVKAAEKLGVRAFRGAEEDVLDRYYQAAKSIGLTRGDTVVRITGDCPLMDPAVVDKVVNFYIENLDKYDYASNVRPPTYPDGMDVEVFSFAALEKSWKEAKLNSEREHATAYIGSHPELFRIGNVENKKNLSNLRLTVDNPEDLEVISILFKALYPTNPNFGLAEIADFLSKNPQIAMLNKNIRRNEGYEKSLKEDQL